MKANYVYDVTDYDATGDGVTDDSAAIQAAPDAADAAGGGKIFVPPGTYLLNTGLHSAKASMCAASPPRVTIRLYAAAGWAFTETGSASGGYNAMGGYARIGQELESRGTASGRSTAVPSLSDDVVVDGDDTGGTLLSIEYDSEGSAFCFFENLTLIDGEIGLSIDGGAATFSNRGTGTGILIHGCELASIWRRRRRGFFPMRRRIVSSGRCSVPLPTITCSR